MKPATLVIRTATGETRQIALDRALILGRDAACTLAFPEDGGLSRQHLRIDPKDGEWILRDLESRNGTFVNGRRIAMPHTLQPGDTIRASKTQLFLRPPEPEPAAVVFESAISAPPLRHTVVTRLRDLLDKPSADADADTLPPEASQAWPSAGIVRKNWSSPVEALLRAGRELVAGRPLPELFQVILDLAIEAVGAERGVLLTLEQGLLVEQARSAGEFHISSTVRDRVILEGASLLAHDAKSDAVLQGRRSILLQNVLSLIAVPLQTEDRIIGLIYVDSRSTHRLFTAEHLNLLTVMANVAAIRIERARLALVEKAEERHRLEMEQAAIIQQRSLPARPPRVPGYSIDGRSLSCQAVGGDYFDYLTLADGRLLVLIADVAGKGMPAALLVMSLQANAHALAPTCADLGTFLTRLNHALVPRCPNNRFITVFACALDPESGACEFGNAGHNTPMLFRASGEMELLRGGGPPLGIAARAKFPTGQTALAPGDHLLLYTDGITEAETATEEQFEEAGLERTVRERAGAAPELLIDGILQAVELFTAGAPASDDRTLVSLRRQSPA